MLSIIARYEIQRQGRVETHDVTKVGVQTGLDQPSHHGDGIVCALGKVSECKDSSVFLCTSSLHGYRYLPIDPVGNVQPPVQRQRRQVMRGDRLGLSGPGQHEQLRENGHALEPDGKGPQDLGGDELVVEDQG